MVQKIVVLSILNIKIRVSALTPDVTYERGLREGKLNTPTIVAFGTAIKAFSISDSIMRHNANIYEIIYLKHAVLLNLVSGL